MSSKPYRQHFLRQGQAVPWDLVQDRKWDQIREGVSRLNMLHPMGPIAKGGTGLSPQDTTPAPCVGPGAVGLRLGHTQCALWGPACPLGPCHRGEGHPPPCWWLPQAVPTGSPVDSEGKWESGRSHCPAGHTSPVPSAPVPPRGANTVSRSTFSCSHQLTENRLPGSHPTLGKLAAGSRSPLQLSPTEPLLPSHQGSLGPVPPPTHPPQAQWGWVQLGDWPQTTWFRCDLVGVGVPGPMEVALT